ncbi:MAG: hypothetical protein J5563_08655 [Clostridia bacterium]|nr:hypothetical protein [Clostridia bacterium]
MKKLISLIVAVILLAGMMSIVMSAGGAYLADKEIPYGTAKIDGKFDEWSKAAKFTIDGSNAKVVSGTWTEGNSVSAYLMYDDTYLYYAYEVTNNDQGLLYYGAPGDVIDMLFDIDGVAAANGNINMQDSMIRSFVVVANAGSTDVTGVHIGYPRSEVAANRWINGAPDNTVLTDVAGAGSGTTYFIENRVKLADLKSMLSNEYAGATVPDMKAGTVFTFMLSVDNCGKNQLQSFWAIAQDTQIETAAAVPSYFGFRGVFAEKSASTADMTAIVVLISAVAAGAVALTCKKH